MPPAQGLQPQALVSLWRDPDHCGEDQFVCSGIIVADNVILTVAHPFLEQRPPVCIRPYADGAQSYPMMGKPIQHASLDAALLKIEAMPATAHVAPVDPYGRTRPNMSLFLNGFRKGKYELAHETDYLCFEARDRRHVISSKQPPGYSGCGISLEDQLWGMAFAHYTDGNIHRGCVLSCGQLWDGFLDAHVPLPHAQKISIGDIPSHDVERRARQIRRLIADNDFQAANAGLLDFARDAKNPEELDEATLISMSVHELLRQNPPLGKSLAFRKQLAGDMLRLINRIMKRLLGANDES